MSLPLPINWLHRSRIILYFVTGRRKIGVDEHRNYPEENIGLLSLNDLYIFTDLEEADAKARQEVMAPGHLGTGGGWKDGKVFDIEQVVSLKIKEPNHQVILGSSGLTWRHKTKIIRKYGAKTSKTGHKHIGNQVYVIEVTF